MVEHDIAVEQQLIDEFLESAESAVELSVAAQSDRLPIIRAVVESTLYLDDWTVDDVADVKLGVDEICSQLIAVSEAGRRLTVTIRPGRLGMVGQIEGSTGTGLDLDTAGFGWRVVETVTDTQTLTYVDSGGDRRVTVRFAKRRTAL
ncbi:anti-sigma factor [Gordonia bronchialis]|uniref:anti-sigma factor n=1 Tax=Gordonia bronchialis TaxID=2054 RepID=UPI00242D1A6B|nr:anti-sigma factor [Gordonia bronchialis]